MVKTEAVQLLKVKFGFLPHSMIWDLWQDHEDVPDAWVEAELSYCQGPPEPYRIYMGAAMYEKFNQALNEYANSIFTNRE